MYICITLDVDLYDVSTTVHAVDAGLMNETAAVDSADGIINFERFRGRAFGFWPRVGHDLFLAEEDTRAVLFSLRSYNARGDYILYPPFFLSENSFSA